MGYFEEKQYELKSLLRTIEEEKKALAEAAKSERTSIATDLHKLKRYDESLQLLKSGIDALAKERQIGFPWLANAYKEAYKLLDSRFEGYLRKKKRPAVKAAEAVKEETRKRREAEKLLKIAQYQIEYYENIAPFLIDLKEEVELPTEEEQQNYRKYTEQEREDKTTEFLSVEEYRKLSTSEKNQLALDRYWSRPKSKAHIGKIYERYVGYLYETKGYEVEFVGIIRGLEDLGRDLVCKKGGEMIIIQCKNWSQFKVIYEKHIFQFFGTVFEFKDSNPEMRVSARFVTSTKLSDLARRFSKALDIDLDENFKMDKEYPSIKCNISKKDKTKIYHLPFDQMYDKVKIEPDKGEFYCKTVEEAEKLGFRRAFRYLNAGD